MPAPSPRTKPSRLRSNGRDALCGLVVAGREGGQQVEAGDAERVDHAVRAAGEHQVGVAVADQLGRLADGLAAGGAGGQAVVSSGPARSKWAARWPAGVCSSCSHSRVGVRSCAGAVARTRPRSTLSRSRRQRGPAPTIEVVEVLDALAGAEVDAEAGAVDLAVVEQAGVVQGLLGGGEREAAVHAAVGEALRRRAIELAPGRSP